MSTIRLSGSSSGHYDLTVPAVAGTNSIDLSKLVVRDANDIAQLHTGSIIQMAGDTWNPGTVYDVSTATVVTGQYGANLEVSMTFRSTSNKFFAKVFIPDGYDNAGRTRALEIGFKYSTDNFSTANTLGVQQIISDHSGYVSAGGPDLLTAHVAETFGDVPVAGAVKIRPFVIARNGTYRTNANNMGVYCLTVMEIKG